MAKNTESSFLEEKDIPDIENLLCQAVSYIRKNHNIPFICNVEFEVYCDKKDNFTCSIVRDVEYMYSYIRVNIAQYNDIDNVISDFCHEIGHVALIEYWSFFNVFIGYEDEEQIAYQTYKRSEEVVACLIGDLLKKEINKEWINEC